MLHTAASDLGLHCLLRPVCLNTVGPFCLVLFGSHRSDQQMDLTVIIQNAIAPDKVIIEVIILDNFCCET